MRVCKFIITAFLLGVAQMAYSQLDDLFWFAMPEITPQHGGSEPTFLRISSAVDKVYGDHVIVDMPATGYVLYDGVVAVGTTYNLNLTNLIQQAYGAGWVSPEPHDNILESGQLGTEGIVEKRGIRIRSLPRNALDTENDITVYCDRAHSNNRDIWSLKGRNGLGTSFTVPMQNIWPNVNFANEPKALSGFDIVATKAGTSITINAKAPFRLAGGSNTFYAANTDHTFSLGEGETFAVVAENHNINRHFGGSKVTSSEPIAVTWRDDSVRPIGQGYDVTGDQLIPDELAGYEYIVMRGELASNPTTTKKCREYAFILAIENNTNLISSNASIPTYGMFTGADVNGTFPTGGVTTLSAGQIGRILMNARNHNNGVATAPGTDATKVNYDALYMKFDKPVIVFHITGFGDEVGGAVVPSIDLCTGSKNVSIVRTNNTMNFYLNLMTRTYYKDSIKVKIAATEYPLDETLFESVAGTDWWVLKKVNNNFTTNATSPIGVAAPTGSPIQVISPGRFHLGTIEGDGAGCKYGYFSSFSADSGSVSVGADEAIAERYCWGDTIKLKAKGANYYQWWYAGSATDNHQFLTDSTLAKPLATLEPNGSIKQNYLCRIVRDCYTTEPIDTLPVQVIVYEKLESKLDTIPLSPNCCSPTDYKLVNHPQTLVNYNWSIPRESDTIQWIGNYFLDTVIFSNHSYAPVYYDVELIANKNYLCYDTIITPIKVKPNIVAKMLKGTKAGCQQDITQGFAVDTVSAGPFTDAVWDWGDGTGRVNVTHALSTDTIYHTFVNLTNFDTTYFVTLIVIDSVNDCKDTADIFPVVVPGVARARYSISNKKGCSPLTVNIQNNSNGIVSYRWWFHNGNDTTTVADNVTNFANTNVTYTNFTANPIQKYVFLEITKLNDDGSTCIDTYGPDTITIYPQWTTAITPAGPPPGCNPVTVDFNRTLSVAVPNLTYNWQFGDGSSYGLSIPPSKQFVNNTPSDITYPVTLTTTSEYNCVSTATPVNVTVYRYNDALFTVSPDTFSCNPSTFSLRNITATNAGVTTSTWTDNGNPFVPATNPFNLTYNNTSGVIQNHAIRLVNSNSHAGCDEVFEKILTTKPEFTVDFNPNVSLICHNGSITFTDASTFTGMGNAITAPHTFYWEFGDGTTSNLESPTHIFKNTQNNGILPQTFTVKLTVTANGCPKFVTKTIQVLPEVKAIISAPSYEVCTPGSVSLTSNSVGAASFTWSFSDGSPNNSTSPYSWPVVNTSPAPGSVQNKTVTLTAVNGTCTNVATKVFKVHPPIVPQFTALPASGCNPLPVSITNTSTGGTLTYSWVFGDGDVGTNSGNFSHTFTNTTNVNKPYNIVVTATNSAGCSVSANQTVTVLPFVGSSFDLDQSAGCSPFTVSVRNTTPNNSIKNFTWNLAGGVGVVSNTVPFNVTYNNITGAPVNHTITLTNTNGTGACDSVYSRTITVYPEITSLFSSSADTICSGQSITFTNQSFYTSTPTLIPANAATYAWDFGDTETSILHAPAAHTFVNTENNGSTPQKFTISLTVSANGCSHTFTKDVFVRPEVKPIISAPVYQICTPNTITIQNTSTGANQFIWSFNDGVTSSINMATTASINYAVDNLTPNTTNTYRVTLTASNNGLCTASTFKDFQVLPHLLPSFTALPASGCNPLPVSITNTSTGGVLTFSWVFGDGDVGTNPGNFSHTFTNTTNVNKPYNIVVTATNSAGCSVSANQTVTVLPFVGSSFDVDQSAGCSPFTVSVRNTTPNNSIKNFTWNLAGGVGVVSNTVPFNVTYTNTTGTPINRTITLTNTNGTGTCDSVYSRTITVYPEITSLFSSSADTICSGANITFTNQSFYTSTPTLIPANAANYAWDFGDTETSILHTPAAHTFVNTQNLGTTVQKFTVSLTVSANGCSHTFTKDVYVRPVVKPIINAAIYQICTPDTITIQNNSTGANRFIWSFNDGVTANINTTTTASINYAVDNPTPNTTNTYRVTLTASNNGLCTTSTFKEFQVLPHLVPQFTLDTASGCNPLTVNITNTSTGGNLTYKWTFDDGDEVTNSGNFDHTFNNTTSISKPFVIKVVATNTASCSESISRTVTVLPFVAASFTTDKLNDCSPATIQVTNTTPANSVIGFSWAHDGGGATNNTTFPLSYTNLTNAPVLHTITLTNSNGTPACNVTDSKTVTINPEITPRFTRSDDTICHNTPITFTNRSFFTGMPASFITGATATAKFKWDFGDGTSSSSATPPAKTYKNTTGSTGTAPQKYYVTLELTVNGCIETYIDSFYVRPPVKALFSTPKTALCDGETIRLTNTSVGANRFHWVSSDGVLDVWRPMGNPNFTANNTSANDKQYIKIYLTATNNDCQNTDSLLLTVYPEIVPQFTPNQTAFCGPDTVVFTNSSLGGNATDNQLVYTWDFNDGTTPVPANGTIKHQFRNLNPTDANYNVKLTAVNAIGCTDFVQQLITVYPEIEPKFTAAKQGTCTPVQVKFTNTSLNGNQFSWDFGHLGKDTVTTNKTAFNYLIENTNPLVPATYTVKLVVNNTLHPECKDSVTAPIRINPNVIPVFTVANDTGCSPLTSTLINASTGYKLNYIWNYGDLNNGNSTLNSHDHTYNNLTASDITYTVTLTATDTAGCAKTVTQQVTAFPYVEANFSYSSSTQCSPYPVTFKNTSTNGSMFEWDFGMGEPLDTTYSPANFDHTYRNLQPDSVSISTYTITLSSIDKNHRQCRNNISKTIKILPEVISRFAVTDNDIGCSPLPAEFTNTSKGYKNTYVWDYKDNYFSSDANPVHVHQFDNRNTGNKTYRVRLIATDSLGCSKVSEQPVTAYPHVTSNFTFLRTGTNCTPVEYEFKYANLNGTLFEWDMGQNGETRTFNNTFPHKYTYDNPFVDNKTFYDINLLVTDENTGCQHDTTRQIEVFPRIISKFDVDTTEGCNPLTVVFSNKSTGGLMLYQWNFDDSGELSSLTSPTKQFEHALNADKTFTPTLQATQVGNEVCTSVSDTNILVYSYVNANFSLKKDLSTEGGNNEISSGCTELSLFVSDLATTNKTWTWDFGRNEGTVVDNAAPAPRNQKYLNTDNIAPLDNKTYDITLIVENQHGCTDTLIKPLVVFPRSVPNFNVELTGCSPHTANFNTKNAVVDNGTNYFWTLGDGYEQDEASFIHRYINYSNTDNKPFEVWLYTETSNHCIDSITKTITVYPKPLANILADADASCPPFYTNINNLSVGTGLTYRWNFANGNTNTTTSNESQKPVYYNNTDNPLEHNVRMIAVSGNNCSDTAFQKITVYPNVSAEIDYFELSDIAGCSPHTVEFKNMSNTPAVYFEWNFGNGVVSKLKNPTYKYINTTDDDQTYVVSLFAESLYGCDSTITDTITVYLSPAAEYEVIDRVQDYPDTVITFRNLVNPGPWTYEWKFDDGSPDSNTDARSFEHAYNGWGRKADGFTFTTSLNVYSDHCQDDTTITLIIGPPDPTISIENETPEGCVPLTVQFATDYTYGYPDSFKWDFGDGGESSEQNPEYEYVNPGIYVAKVSMEGDGGNAQATQIVDVFFLPTPDFRFSPDFVMLPHQPVQFYNISLNSSTYLWSFGDGTTDTALNPIHQYTYEYLPGHNITLVATSEQGCVDSITYYNAVIVSGEGFVEFPNAFLPTENSPQSGNYPIPDYIGDVFHPMHSGVKTYELWIFNRWGEQLYYSDDVYKGWNGRYGNTGELLGQDVYFWKSKGTYNNDVPFKLAGDVTLIRR